MNYDREEDKTLFFLQRLYLFEPIFPFVYWLHPNDLKPKHVVDFCQQLEGWEISRKISGKRSWISNIWKFWKLRNVSI